jgi:hypothetical protein
MSETEQGTVVSLRSGDISSPHGPVAKVVVQLEKLLTEARAGEIRAIAYATIDGGGRSTTGWQLGDGHAGHLVGAAARLQFQLCRSWDDCAEDVA